MQDCYGIEIAKADGSIIVKRCEAIEMREDSHDRVFDTPVSVCAYSFAGIAKAEAMARTRLKELSR